MSTVSSATAPSVGPSYVPTSSSLWNNRIVIIGGLAACAGLFLLFLARRYLGGSESTKKIDLGSIITFEQGIVKIRQDFLMNGIIKTTHYTQPITILIKNSSGEKIIRATFTYNQFSHPDPCFEAFIEKLPLGETVEADIFQSEWLFQSKGDGMEMELQVCPEIGIYTIMGIRKNDVSLVPQPLPQKVNAPYEMANHKIEKPLAISISSDGQLTVHDRDPLENGTIETELLSDEGKAVIRITPEPNYYFLKNSTSKTHILAFQLIGRSNQLPGGKQQLTVHLVVPPTGEKKNWISPEQISRSWEMQYLDNNPRCKLVNPPQLELVSIQDMTL